MHTQRAHTHAQKHIDMHVYVLTTCTFMNMHEHTWICMHTCMHINMHINSHTHKYAHKTCADTGHAHILTQMHTCIHLNECTCTHIRTQTSTHVNIYTQTLKLKILKTIQYGTQCIILKAIIWTRKTKESRTSRHILLHPISSYPGDAGLAMSKAQQVSLWSPFGTAS